MAENRSRGKVVTSSRAPYWLAAISLASAATCLALGVLVYGLSDYHPGSTLCLEALRRGGTIGQQPGSCTLPVGSILLAGLIFLGGLCFAWRVWSRR